MTKIPIDFVKISDDLSTIRRFFTFYGSSHFTLLRCQRTVLKFPFTTFPLQLIVDQFPLCCGTSALSLDPIFFLRCLTVFEISEISSETPIRNVVELRCCCMHSHTHTHTQREIPTKNRSVPISPNTNVDYDIIHSFKFSLLL